MKITTKVFAVTIFCLSANANSLVLNPNRNQPRSWDPAKILGVARKEILAPGGSDSTLLSVPGNQLLSLESQEFLNETLKKLIQKTIELFKKANKPYLNWFQNALLHAVLGNLFDELATLTKQPSEPSTATVSPDQMPQLISLPTDQPDGTGAGAAPAAAAASSKVPSGLQPVLTYEQLMQHRVEPLPRVRIIDIQSHHPAPGATYCYRDKYGASVVLATAVFRDGRRIPVQRIMVGQVWAELLRSNNSLGTDQLALGRLISHILGEPVVVYGMLALGAVRTTAGPYNRPVPAMVGFWISIDPRDYPHGLPNLQRALALFTPEAILIARTDDEKVLLRKVADQRRAAGNSGLPESCVTLEPAKTLPQKINEREVHAYRYYPTTTPAAPGTQPVLAARESQALDMSELRIGELTADKFEPWERKWIERLFKETNSNKKELQQPTLCHHHWC